MPSRRLLLSLRMKLKLPGSESRSSNSVSLLWRKIFSPQSLLTHRDFFIELLATEFPSTRCAWRCEFLFLFSSLRALARITLHNVWRYVYRLLAEKICISRYHFRGMGAPEKPKLCKSARQFNKTSSASACNMLATWADSQIFDFFERLLMSIWRAGTEWDGNLHSENSASKVCHFVETLGRSETTAKAVNGTNETSFGD